MRMRFSFVVLSVALLAFAPAPFAKKERRVEDLTDVAGTWEIVQWVERGRRSVALERLILVEVKENRFAFVAKDDPQGADADGFFSMRRHPTAQPPAFTLSRRDRLCYLGSYRLRQGQMTLIFNESSKIADRPTDFAGQPDYRLILRRIKRD